MTSNEVILKAKELIERDGWIQGSFREFERDGWIEGSFREFHGEVCRGRCLLGALRDAAILDLSLPDAEFDVQFKAYRAARTCVADLIFDDARRLDVLDWNDAPGRTKAEVLELLEKAAQ